MHLPVGTTYDVGIVVVVDVIQVGTVGRISTAEEGNKPVRSTQCIIIFAFYYTVNIIFNSPSENKNSSLHSPLPALSAPLTLKEYTTPVCSVSTMYCDVVSMFVMLLVLVLVTSTWYTTTHWLSRNQVRLKDDSLSVVPSILIPKLVGAFGGPKDKKSKQVSSVMHVYLMHTWSTKLMVITMYQNTKLLIS